MRTAQASGIPIVGLPRREEIERAIHPWWQGGGTTRVIVDNLRRLEATTAEAQQVAERLAAKADAGTRFISADAVEEQLEMVRAGTAWRVGRQLGPNTDYDPMKCVFGDGVACPQCSEIEREPVVHGRLLEPEDAEARIGEIQQYLADIVKEQDEHEDWQRKKAATLRMRKGPMSEGGKVCAGSDEPPIEQDGKLYCPGCDVEVPDFIHRIPAKTRPST